MIRSKYDEYRDVLSCINKRNFSTFIRIYEDGPIPIKRIKNTKAVNELLDGGYVVRRWLVVDSIPGYYYRTTVIGERIFEAIAGIVDGWGNGSVVRYTMEDGLER